MALLLMIKVGVTIFFDRAELAAFHSSTGICTQARRVLCEEILILNEKVLVLTDND